MQGVPKRSEGLVWTFAFHLLFHCRRRAPFSSQIPYLTFIYSKNSICGNLCDTIIQPSLERTKWRWCSKLTAHFLAGKMPPNTQCFSLVGGFLVLSSAIGGFSPAAHSCESSPQCICLEKGSCFAESKRCEEESTHTTWSVRRSMLHQLAGVRHPANIAWEPRYLHLPKVGQGLDHT